MHVRLHTACATCHSVAAACTSTSTCCMCTWNCVHMELHMHHACNHFLTPLNFLDGFTLAVPLGKRQRSFPMQVLRSLPCRSMCAVLSSLHMKTTSEREECSPSHFVCAQSRCSEGSAPQCTTAMPVLVPLANVEHRAQLSVQSRCVLSIEHDEKLSVGVFLDGRMSTKNLEEFGSRQAD